MDWMASGTASWILFSIGVLSAALATIVVNLFPDAIVGRRRTPLFFKLLAKWSPAIVGPLLLLSGTVAAGTGAGQRSWPSIISGALCLFVFAYLSLLRRLDVIRRNYDLDTRRDYDRYDRHEYDPGHRSILGTRRDYLLAEAIAPEVARQVRDLLGPFRDSLARSSSVMSPSVIADAVYLNLAKEDLLPARRIDSFDDFANSMVRAGRWVPVSVYTTAHDGTALKDVVAAVLLEFGLMSVVEEPPIQGSWMQRFWTRSREVVGSQSVRGRLAELEQAIHLEYLGKRRAEIDTAKTESVAALVTAIKDQENAVVRIGSIIVIKTQGDLVVWTISEMEAAALEKNSDLLSDPVAALKFLQNGRQQQGLSSLESPARDASSD